MCLLKVLIGYVFLPVFVSCGSLPDVRNSIISPGSSGAGTVRTFVCVLPFVVTQRDVPYGLIFCRPSGHWTVSGLCSKLQ